MNRVIAFAGSNSSKSINHELVTYAASQFNDSEVIKLTDYTIPMYGIDVEESEGIPNGVKELDKKLSEAELFIISVAEHNGNITAFLKNNIDWLSRNNREFLKDKKIIVLSTSPGPGGGASALNIIKKTLPYFGGEVIAELSIGSFYENFKEGKLINAELNNNLMEVLDNLK